MAEFIPISNPLVLISAPPLLPWFTAASVCMKDSTGELVFVPLFKPRLRALALTIPAVTVVSKLSG